MILPAWWLSKGNDTHTHHQQAGKCPYCLRDLLAKSFNASRELFMLVLGKDKVRLFSRVPVLGWLKEGLSYLETNPVMCVSTGPSAKTVSAPDTGAAWTSPRRSSTKSSRLPSLPGLSRLTSKFVEVKDVNAVLFLPLGKTQTSFVQRRCAEICKQRSRQQGVRPGGCCWK